MAYLTDIEIAQSTPMQPITDIAKVAGVDEDYIEQYGKYDLSSNVQARAESYTV